MALLDGICEIMRVDCCDSWPLAVAKLDQMTKGMRTTLIVVSILHRLHEPEPALQD
jgi:hypothetical protein